MRAAAMSKPMDLSHNIFPRLQPYLQSWLNIYGKNILMWLGEKWAKQRKLANHAFYAESLKNMIPAMIESVEIMLERIPGFRLLWKKGIARLKKMTMVINETLRLYPPVIGLSRKVERESKLGRKAWEGRAAFKIAKKLQAIKLKTKEWNMLAFGDINPKEWNMLAFGDVNVKLLEAEKRLHEWDLLGESRSLTADENY
ncbi:hypothetical protein Vadar_022995 [Vaccinium darrowii]|uniref:Uncharacterized protein n=1 Tax=Vaccinium darrowii TaxID=229202 RepID=A0ACB7XJC3_9ERIC|nr:hypothetical protein Vadar_022995 [Vaccinium darrowii]